MRTRELADHWLLRWPCRLVYFEEAEGASRNAGVTLDTLQQRDRGHLNARTTGLPKLVEVYKRPVGAERYGNGAR